MDDPSSGLSTHICGPFRGISVRVAYMPDRYVRPAYLHIRRTEPQRRGFFNNPPPAEGAASGFRRCGNTMGGARFWQRREGTKRRNGSFPRPAVSPGRNRALASSGPGSRRRDSPGVMSGADSIQPPGAMSQRPGSRARICPQLPLEGFGWAILPVCGFERESSSPGSASPTGAGSRWSGSEGAFAARKLARPPSFSRIGLRRESVSPPGSEFPKN